MLSNVNGNLFSLLLVSIHENPLDEIVAILITSNVNERDAWSIWMGSGDDIEITIKKLNATNLEALLDDLGGILVDAVAISVDENVVNDPTLVGRSTVLAQVLDAPITELAMGNEINVRDDFFNSGTLLIFYAVLEDVLND